MDYAVVLPPIKNILFRTISHLCCSLQV